MGGRYPNAVGWLRLEASAQVASWGDPLSCHAGPGSPPGFLALLSNGLGVSPAQASPAQGTYLRRE